MRIDRLLANLGYGTRKEIKALMKNNQVNVNEKLCLDPAYHVDVDNDKISLDKTLISLDINVYIMLHKPQGLVCANSDHVYPTVFTCIDRPLMSCFVAGRLDVDTTGFVFITNDGKLAHKLFSNKKHIPKTYIFTLAKELNISQIALLESGSIKLDHKNILPARVNSVGNCTYQITISEGKHHQIKRMINAVGLECVDLHRIAIGGLYLDQSLKEGEWRYIDETEIKQMLEPIC